MRTIEKLLEYNITDEERPGLLASKFINGIGGQGENIESLLLESIMLMSGYDRKKSTHLLADIRLLSEEHDLKYRLQLGFYRSNYVFSKKLMYLLTWGRPINRLALALICFIILNRHGKKHYISSK